MRISAIWGAIAGDIVGSIYENHPIKTEAFPLIDENAHFTDDTVLTVAVADAILNRDDYAAAIRRYGKTHPHAGYGGMFRQWLHDNAAGPYNSFGNGSAMRVSAVGMAFDNEDEVLDQAKQTAAPTHNHPEGVKGAQAVALAILLARQDRTKEEIKGAIESRFGYNLHRSLTQIRPTYRFDVTCQGSVPESIVAFLESNGTEDAIRKAISLGGDADTMGCIAGSIAAACYKQMANTLLVEVRARLPIDLLEVVEEFDRRFGQTDTAGE